MLRIASRIYKKYDNKVLAFNFCSDSSRNGSNKKNQSLDNLEIFFKDNMYIEDEKTNTRIHKYIKPTMTVFNKKKKIKEKDLSSEIPQKPNENSQPSLKQILNDNIVIKKPKKKKHIDQKNEKINPHKPSLDLTNLLENNLNINKLAKSKSDETVTLKSNDLPVSDNIWGILNENSSIRRQQRDHILRDNARDFSVSDDIQEILNENSSIRQDNQKHEKHSQSDTWQRTRFRHQPFQNSSSESASSKLADLTSIDMETELSVPPVTETPINQQDCDNLMQLLDNIDFHQVSRVFPVKDVPDIDYESFIDKDSLKRLNIFEKDQFEDRPQLEECLNFLDVVESCEFRQLNTQVPPTQFHEWIQWTQDKKLWRFPIDNEQDSEELTVKFHEHVFPQQYLTGRLPKTGPIGQFMNYVCVGLSQSANLTVEQKRAHIRWYEDYLAPKVDECNTAVLKSKTN